MYILVYVYKKGNEQLITSTMSLIALLFDLQNEPKVDSSPFCGVHVTTKDGK